MPRPALPTADRPRRAAGSHPLARRTRSAALLLTLCLAIQACGSHSSQALDRRAAAALQPARAAPTYQVAGLTGPQQASLAEAARYSEAHKGAALLVLRDGQRIFEHYAGGADAGSAFLIASGTKSFWGVVALAAVQDGLISLDEPVASTLTEWAGDPGRSAITVRHLLTFTSGLASGEKQLRRSRDLYQAALRVEMVAAPGTVYTYGPSHLAVFGAFLDRRLGPGENPLGYLRRRILDPIGMRYADWHTDGQGHAILASGARLNAREWAKFGQLLLDQGRAGQTQLIAPALMRELVRPSAVNPLYGLTVWLNNSLPPGMEDRVRGIRMFGRMEGGRWGTPLAPDLVMAAGKGDHRLYVIPSLRMVVVRLSHRGDPDWSDATFLQLLLNGPG